MDKMHPNIRPATPDEHPILEDLAFRSKAHWGYGSAFMEASRPFLKLNMEQIENNHCFICEEKRKTLGFYSFNMKSTPPELTHLFVDPEYIGIGIGNFLWNHAITLCRNTGFSKFTFEADPNAAEKFYLKKGCRIITMQKSEVDPGRQIPLMEFEL
ncbi:MAG: GNAT family N-acetyltransferase [Methyloligellaceae bacterium]